MYRAGVQYRGYRDKGDGKVNASGLRLLICRQAMADSVEISKTRDIEAVIQAGSKLRHLVITSNGQMYVDGWPVNYVIEPDMIGSITVHDRLTEEDIQRRARRFSDRLRSSR